MKTILLFALLATLTLSLFSQSLTQKYSIEVLEEGQ